MVKSKAIRMENFWALTPPRLKGETEFEPDPFIGVFQSIGDKRKPLNTFARKRK